MANTTNLQVITRKLMSRLTQDGGDDVRREIVAQLLALCEKFKQEFDWFISTFNQVSFCFVHVQNID